jgi:hypothetical protein
MDGQSIAHPLALAGCLVGGMGGTVTETDRDLLARAFHDYEAAVKAARKLWPNGQEATIREAAADFLVHVRELRRNGNSSTPPTAPVEPSPPCPVCQGPMKDQRAGKRGNQPDFKCHNRDCDGAVWLDRKRPSSPTTTR